MYKLLCIFVLCVFTFIGCAVGSEVSSEPSLNTQDYQDASADTLAETSTYYVVLNPDLTFDASLEDVYDAQTDIQTHCNDASDRATYVDAGTKAHCPGEGFCHRLCEKDGRVNCEHNCHLEHMRCLINLHKPPLAHR